MSAFVNMDALCMITYVCVGECIYECMYVLLLRSSASRTYDIYIHDVYVRVCTYGCIVYPHMCV